MLFDPAFCADELQRPYVQKGAAWLDETQPRWVEKIVPRELRMSTCNFCICGQVFGSYMQRPDDVDEGDSYGFTIHGSVEEVFATPCLCGKEECRYLLNETRARLLWDSLDRLWGDEVYWRLG